jgi:hypothetical protein
LRTVLESSSCSLLANNNSFELIMDSGCSKPVSPCKANFVPGSLIDLDVRLTMDEMAGQLVAHRKGRLRYKILNNAGGVFILKYEGYLLPGLKV